MKSQIFFCLLLLSACIDEVRLDIGENTEDVLVVEQSIQKKQDHRINNGWLVDARFIQEMDVVLQDHSIVDQTTTIIDQNIQIPDQAIVIADQMIAIPDQAVVIADQAIVIADQSVDMNPPRQVLNCIFNRADCQSLRINEINYETLIGERRFIEIYHSTNYDLSQNDLRVEIQEVTININQYSINWHAVNRIACTMSSQQFYICDIGLLNSFDNLEFDSSFDIFDRDDTQKILNIKLIYQGLVIDNIWHMDENFYDRFNRLSGNLIQGLQAQIIPKLDNQESSLSRCDQTDNAFERLTVSFGQANPCN